MPEQASTTVASATDPTPTPLRDLHVERGGRMVDFAGWSLPIQFEGVIAEHVACRAAAALFDVSHMGIVELRPTDGATVAVVADRFETLTPAAITTLEPGRQRYCLLTNDTGGVIDDCIVTGGSDHLTVVVNASRRDVDLAHFRDQLDGVDVVERTDLALLALQGPRAAAALAEALGLGPAVESMVFLDFVATEVTLDGRTIPVGLSRSGYTGEDGFELSVPADGAEAVARALLADAAVTPAGLGARDTLRLEAGLALYGNDLDPTTSPVEADLVWTMPKRRRADARFAGADRILAEYRDGPSRRRVGLRPLGRRPVRSDTPLRTAAGEPAGTVTSGGFGPTVDGPVAMGYVPSGLVDQPEVLIADVRGRDVEVEIAELPFVATNYHRGA